MPNRWLSFGSAREGNGGFLPLRSAAWMCKSMTAVQCLVDGCPDALLEKTNDGTLALHIAVGSHLASLPEVRCLLDGCPMAVKEGDRNGLLPLHHAVEGGALVPVLRCLVEAFPEALEKRDNNG
jgi:hypothetical protein